MDIVQDIRILSPHEKWLQDNLKKHCLALSSLSRTIARLRSRIGWIKEGDANTALFHAKARYRKSKNFIAKVASSDGQILTAHEDKSAAFYDFHEALLGSCEVRDTTIDLDALAVATHDLAAQDAPFSEKEVWEMIKRLPSHKAPGPDGFTGHFYKSCCSIIKIDLMTAISCVWARKFKNMKPLNSAYSTLLPKTETTYSEGL
jgi:hypothetical protein